MWSDNGLEMSFWVKKLQLFEHVLLVTKLRDELQEVMHVEWHGGCFGKYLCSGSIYLMKMQLIHLLLNMYRWITGLCLFVIPLSHTLNMWWMLRLVVSVAASLSFSFIPASLSLRHMCKLEQKQGLGQRKGGRSGEILFFVPQIQGSFANLFKLSLWLPHIHPLPPNPPPLGLKRNTAAKGGAALH